MPTTESRILQEIRWKKQAVEDCAARARIIVKDKARLDDFRAGVAVGWDECIKTLKLHEWVKI